ncbi:MAG: MFS transporter [Tatlockia sp.]|nr:MFS transporter [Tatlockia sp.]
MISNFRIALLLSYISLPSFSAAFITPALPQIALSYGLQKGQVDWVISIFLIGYVIGQLIYGPLANRWGRLSAFRIGLTINLLGIVLCMVSVMTNSFWLLLIGRLVSAFGASSGLACTYMIINEWLDKSQRKSAMAYTILVFTLGIGIAVTLGGLISEYGNWIYCFPFLFVHGLLALVGTVFFPETLQKSIPLNFSSVIDGYKQVLHSKMLVLFSLVIGFCSSMAYCFSAAAPQITIDLFHLSPAEYGYWNLLNMLGMLLGGLWAKALFKRMPPKELVRLGFFCCSFGVLSLLDLNILHSISPLWFFLSTASLYLFSGFMFAGGTYLASNALDDKASCSSMMSFINLSVAASSVILMGYWSKNPLEAYVGMLIGMWIITAVLILLDKFFSEKEAEICDS